MPRYSSSARRQYDQARFGDRWETPGDAKRIDHCPRRHCAISADGRRRAAAAADGVRIWNHAGVLLERFPTTAVADQNAAFTPDGAGRLIAVDAKNVLQFITPSLVQVVSAKIEFTAVAFTPDATAIFVGGADGSIGQYATADLKPMKAFAGSIAVTDIDVSIHQPGRQPAAGRKAHPLGLRRVW